MGTLLFGAGDSGIGGAAKAGVASMTGPEAGYTGVAELTEGKAGSNIVLALGSTTDTGGTKDAGGTDAAKLRICFFVNNGSRCVGIYGGNNGRARCGQSKLGKANTQSISQVQGVPARFQSFLINKRTIGAVIIHHQTTSRSLPAQKHADAMR